jgi:hypothetical protein
LDGKSGGTPISAARLNYLEQGLADARTVETFTTTQRNALTTGQKWEGRVIYNSTTDRLQQWDGAAWFTVPIDTDIAALLDSTGTPAALGTAARGSSTSAARADHVHPKDPETKITIANGITLGPSIANAGEGCEAVRRYNTVTLRYYVSASATVGLALTMPVGWRPSINVRDMGNPTITTVRAVMIGTNGQLTVEGNIASGTSLFGSLTYVCSDT